MKHTTTHYGIGSLVLCALLYSFFGIFARTIGFTIPIFYQTWTRNLLGTLTLFALCLYFKKFTKIKRTDWKWVIARSAIGIVGFFGSFISFNFIPIGTAYFVFYAGSTIGGFMLGKMLFKEKITSIRALSLILALTGLFLIYSANFKIDDLVYVLMAFISGGAAGIWSAISKKISGTYSTLQLNLFDFVLFGLISFSISIVLQEKWVLPALTAPWIANVIAAFVFILTGQLVVIGYKYLTAQIATLIMLLEVLFGIILGFLFYQEVLTPLTFIGGALILSAIILPEINGKRTRVKISL